MENAVGTEEGSVQVSGVGLTMLVYIMYCPL